MYCWYRWASIDLWRWEGRCHQGHMIDFPLWEITKPWLHTGVLQQSTISLFQRLMHSQSQAESWNCPLGLQVWSPVNPALYFTQKYVFVCAWWPGRCNSTAAVIFFLFFVECYVDIYELLRHHSTDQLTATLDKSLQWCPSHQSCTPTYSMTRLVYLLLHLPISATKLHPHLPFVKLLAVNSDLGYSESAATQKN